MPNLWDASPVGRDEEGRSYAARPNSKGRTGRQRQRRAEYSTRGEEVRAGAPIGRVKEPVRRASWGGGACRMLGGRRSEQGAWARWRSEVMS